MVRLIRQIPGRKFNPKLKVWNIPGESKPQLKQVAEIVSRFQNVVWQREEQINPNDNRFFIPPMPELNVNHGLNFEPLAYQAPGIARGLELKRFMNADDPGLGKTFQTIGTIHIANAVPCLVICPGSVKIHWEREFMKFANRKALVLNDKVGDSWPFYIKSGIYDVVIVNFESLKKYFVQTIRTPRGKSLEYQHIVFKSTIDLFKAVIIDEGHRVKDFKAQQTKFTTGIAEGIAEKKEWKIVLTGTPIVNNHIDLISQLRIMGRLEDFGGERYFRQRYCAGPNKASNGRELRAKLWQTCFFRRTKSEVKKDLPPVTRQITTCEISNRREYEFAKKDLASYLKTYKEETDSKQKKEMKRVAWLKMNILGQIAAKGKVKALIEHTRDFQASGKKQLIYAELHEVVDALVKAFPKAVCITGRQNSAEKQRAIDAFSRNPKTTLCIISAAGGTGTDGLQNQCSHIDLLEHPWHDAGCQQIESRLDRGGQKEPVTAQYWQGENTVDEKKWKIVEIKKKISEAIMKGDKLQDDTIADMAIDMFMEDME
ncbi:DEAD/DEAH box helicase [Mangrovibacterium sp.]|uniref:DEAD/DEAH box helicase n=1 Tax=Mangrovibacterium sp. TaxID=1961364 RepID=UPI00356867FF